MEFHAAGASVDGESPGPVRIPVDTSLMPSGPEQIPAPSQHAAVAGGECLSIYASMPGAEADRPSVSPGQKTADYLCVSRYHAVWRLASTCRLEGSLTDTPE